jgi:two-component system LytT family response regulator
MVRETRIRAMIVDDEPRAVAGLRTMLARHADVEVVGEASNGRAALDAIANLQPDVVFLDVQMPALDGLAVAADLDAQAQPLIIFVTAFESHAVDAFALRATDYLLKPVSDDRLAAALERAREELRLRAHGRLHRELRELLGDDESQGESPVRRAAEYASRIAVRVGNRSLLVSVEDIDWFEADGTCSVLHAGDRRLVIRETLDSLEGRLDPAAFTRLHRSTLVNVRRVVELRHPPNAALSVVLRDGTELTVSRRRRDSLLQLIGPSH